LPRFIREAASKVPWWARLLIFLLASLILLEWTKNLPDGFFTDLLEALAFAVLTASILGMLLDYGFRKRLAQDVFEVAFGYFLSPKIRDEIQWVFKLERLAENVSYAYRITQHPDNSDKVWVEEKVIKAIRNISNKTNTVPIGMGVQEWFHKEGHSEILDFSYNLGEAGNEPTKLDIGNAEPNDQGYILAIHADDDPELEAGKQLLISWTSREIRWKNDVSVSYSGSASRNTQITVEIEKGLDLDHAVVFQSRHQPEMITISYAPNKGAYKLPGTLLPLQGIRLRWWEKKMSDYWKKGFDVRSGPEHTE